MLGAKTIGNATLIAFDGDPVLVTDPWFDENPAYFGSWALSHQIPADERDEIARAPYVWFSHGHPDHLNPDSLHRVRGKKILLPDHVGGRIARDLRQQDFDVTVLPDRKWVRLTDRIQIFCIADYIQDAVLLIDVAGALFIDLNDCRARGATDVIRRHVRRSKRSYVLKLSGSGDADMINFFTEAGDQIPHTPNPVPVGQQLSDLAERYGATHVVPFSSFHHYQRADSVWANQHTTPMESYSEGFDASKAEYIEPFVFIDAESGNVTPLRPGERPRSILSPEDFGDNWSDDLEKEDEGKISEYFRNKKMLCKNWEFLRFHVGGRTLTIDLGGPAGRGITFEVPRNSLMQAIEYEIFDDLLIGNFMRTTLHGDVISLYDPDFTFTVAKYGDNGGIETASQLRDYMRQYTQRGGLSLWRDLIAEQIAGNLRRVIDPESSWYQNARRFYLGLS